MHPKQCSQCLISSIRLLIGIQKVTVMLPHLAKRDTESTCICVRVCTSLVFTRWPRPCTDRGRGRGVTLSWTYTLPAGCLAAPVTHVSRPGLRAPCHHAPVRPCPLAGPAQIPGHLHHHVHHGRLDHHD